MSSADSATLAREPAPEYAGRLEALRSQRSAYERRHRRLGGANLGVLVVASAMVFAAFAFRALSILWVLLPAAVFVALATVHARVLRSIRTCQRLMAFYERGMARLANQWMGSGECGERFLEPAHPYARDLDLFGRGSLFELLCAARTRGGEEALANWLLKAAPVSEVHARQAAVEELRGRLDLRQDLAALGEDVRRIVDPEALAAWGEAAAVLAPGLTRKALVALTLMWVACLAAWPLWGRWDLLLVASVVNASIGYRFRKRARKIAPAAGIHSAPDTEETRAPVLSAERVAPGLELLAGVLERLARERFASAKLAALQAALKTDEVAPARAIARLSRLVEYLESRRNMFVALLDPFVFWTLQCAFAVEAWRRNFGGALRGWLAAVGEIEALSSLAGYAYEHPTDVFPEFTEDVPLFEAEGLAHPLISESRAVRNDLRLDNALRLLVISGPNMAGKSTLIRAVGINAVLAQCGSPVRAQRLRLSPLNVAASICVLDSLQGGISRFYAEITRLKLISDLTEEPQPVLFLLDELLNGTNSHDRRVGAEAVVRSLVARGGIGVVTTHDLALARLADDAVLHAANFHFADHLENGELRFDYRLSPGVVETTNALRLMRSIGLEV
jgi:MutS domain V